MAAILIFLGLTAFFERGAHGECACLVCCLFNHLKDCFTYLPHYDDNSVCVRPSLCKVVVDLFDCKTMYFSMPK